MSSPTIQKLHELIETSALFSLAEQAELRTYYDEHPDQIQAGIHAITGIAEKVNKLYDYIDDIGGLDEIQKGIIKAYYTKNPDQIDDILQPLIDGEHEIQEIKGKLDQKVAKLLEEYADGVNAIYAKLQATKTHHKVDYIHTLEKKLETSDPDDILRQI